MHTISCASVVPPRPAQPADIEPDFGCPECGATASNIWFPATEVCVRCRTNAVRQQVARENYERLGHEIAREDSCRRLAAMAPVNSDGWYDTGFAMLVSGRESDKLQRAIAYLRSSGALENHPTDSCLVRHRKVEG